MTDSEFTKVPNYFFEHMADMDKCEQSVVLLIIRKTIGYQKEWDRISFSQFQAATGTKHPLSIQRGIESAINRGIIQRRETKNSYEYRVCEPSKNASLNEVIFGNKEQENTSLNEPKNTSPNEAINKNASLNESKSLHKVKTQKKKEIKDISATQTAQEKPLQPVGQTEKTLTPQQEYFSALCWVVGWDYKTITKEQSGQIAQTVGILQKAGYTKDDLRAFWSNVWAKDWRWTKKQQRPTVTDVRANIGKVKTTATPPAYVNGNAPLVKSVFAQDFTESEA